MCIRLPLLSALEMPAAARPQRSPFAGEVRLEKRVTVPAPIAFLPLVVTLLAWEGSTAQAGPAPAPAPAPAQSSAPQARSGQNSAVAATPARLTLIATPGVTLTASNRGSHDFGQVSLLDQTEITQTFILRNEERTPITIERVKGSCSCTSTVVQRRGKEGSVTGTTAPGTTPATLAPGDEVSVRAVLDLEPLPPGPVRKTVSVYVQGQRDPTVVAEIRGSLLSSVKFVPAQANFGRLDYGEGKVLIVTATFDPRLTAACPPPPLVSSNPSIRIQLLSEDKRRTGPVPPSGRASDAPSRTYRLSVERNVPLGPLEGEISFSPLTVARSPAARPSKGVAAALRSAQLVVVGQVVGDLSAQPSLAFMGVVEKGRESACQIVLTGTNTAAFENLKITSDSAWVSARLGASPAVSIPGSTGDAKERTKTLEVRLAAGTPPGVFQSRLNISLTNGQRLVVPVAAYVKPERDR
jgi:hypothetical protein